MNFSTQAQRPQVQYKYLSLISMIFLAIMLAGNIVTYRFVSVGSLSILAGSFLTPTWFVLSDIVTEVYGYQTYRRMMWNILIASAVFTFLCVFFVSLPYPAAWHHQDKYAYILLKLPRLLGSSFTGIILGAFLNSYCISKWKILVQGRYFWMRSLGSSVIGEFVFTVVTMSTTIFGHVPLLHILQMIGVSFLIKLIITSALLLPSVLVTMFLKSAENVDVYDYDVNFNPFRLSQD